MEGWKITAGRGKSCCTIVLLMTKPFNREMVLSKFLEHCVFIDKNMKQYPITLTIPDSDDGWVI